MNHWLKITNNLIKKIAAERFPSNLTYVYKTTGEVLSFPDPNSPEILDMDEFEEAFGEDYKKWEENHDDYGKRLCEVPKAFRKTAVVRSP